MLAVDCWILEQAPKPVCVTIDSPSQKTVLNHPTMVTLLKWTIEDYHQLINQGLLDQKRVELLDGNIVTMAPESPLHSYVAHTSTEYLRQKLQGLAVVRESHPVTLNHSEPEPDLAIIKPLDSQYKNRHPRAEDIFWLIEISNTTQDYDLNQKKQVYAIEGIKEYWVADLGNDQLIVFREPINGDYNLQQTYSSGSICAEAFPQIELSIQAMFGW